MFVIVVDYMDENAEEQSKVFGTYASRSSAEQDHDRILGNVKNVLGSYISPFEMVRPLRMPQ